MGTGVITTLELKKRRTTTVFGPLIRPKGEIDPLEQFILGGFPDVSAVLVVHLAFCADFVLAILVGAFRIFRVV